VQYLPERDGKTVLHLQVLPEYGLLQGRVQAKESLRAGE
jgi:hypothetical protein